MFRPPSYHPHGGPPRHNCSYPHSSGMAVGAHFVPPAFPLQGRGRFRPPFGGGPYLGSTPSGPPPPLRPPPPPGVPPLEAPLPPPPSEGKLSSIPKATPPARPPMPKDPEMLKNIEVLSSFVVKNGPQFENMARAKQAGDPKFSFLFGGERGTDAALGYDYYNWKKEHLMWVDERTRASPADQRRFSEPTLQGGSGVTGTSQESPGSPAGSDMDMEDDFALPELAGDLNPAVSTTAVEEKPGLSPTSTERRLCVSSPAREWKREFLSPSLEKRPVLSLSAADRKRVLQPNEPVELKAGTSLNVPVDQISSHQGANRELSVQLLVPEQQGSRSNTHGGKTLRVSSASGAQREKTKVDARKRRGVKNKQVFPQQYNEQVRLRLQELTFCLSTGTQRRTGFDRPCMEDVSPHGSPVRFEQRKGSFSAVDPDGKGISGSGQQVLTKASCRGPELSSERLGIGLSLSEKILWTGETTSRGKGSKMSVTFSQKRAESSSTKDRCQSPDVADNPLWTHDDCNVKHNKKLQPKSGSHQPAVDEFGRLLRQGSSDSDVDDDCYGGHQKLKRTSSRCRSGSRSPGDMQSKHWSPSHSPHRLGRRSWSQSRSPRRNRSSSHTPPREGRWGGEGRGECIPLEKDGRRGGRGVGGPPPTCFDFVNGEFFRGSSCRFLHEKINGATGDRGGRWSEGQGRDQEQGHACRLGEEGEQNWGGRSGGDVKLRRPWEFHELTTEDESREMKLIAEQKSQDDESSICESLKQGEGNSENFAKSAKKFGQTKFSKPVKSSFELPTKGFAPSPAAPSTSLARSSVSMMPAYQGGHQTAILPNLSLSQQQSVFSSSSAIATNKLSSLVKSVSLQTSSMVSPTSHSQQLQYSPVLPHPQQVTFAQTLQPQKPALAVPSLSRISCFAANTSVQQPAFISACNICSESPAMTTMKPALATLPLGRRQTSFISLQQANVGQLSSNVVHGGMQFRPSIGGAQPQMLPSPLGQNLQPRPQLARIPVDAKPPVSYPIGPLQALQQPPPEAPPSRAPPPQASSPQVSAALIVYSYSSPLNYAMPSYPTLSSKNVVPQPAPLVHDQFDPVADGLEPAPPGSAEKKGFVSNNQSSSKEHSVRPSAVEQWRHNSGAMSAPLMMNAGEVVLENVSPGLPGHLDSVGMGSGIMGSASPRQQLQTVMGKLSRTDVMSSLNGEALANVGGAQHSVLMENVSPQDQKLTETREVLKESSPEPKEEKRKLNEGRVLNLIRKAVAEHVKDLLKPTWKGGHMSKEAFKTIAKKAVDKVIGALEAKGQIPKTLGKLELFMTTSKPKIAKLVQGYVDKHAKG